MEIAQIGEPILRQRAKQVSDFGSESLQDFIDKMLNAMKQANGIGIAAPQVFDPQAIMIVASKPNPRYPNAPEMEPLVLINPIVTNHSDNLVKDWEGCLSVPGLRGLVPRPDWVEISYQDRQGNQYELKWTGFVARVFLHEYDHLIGTLWIDRVESTTELIAESLFKQKLADGSLHTLNE